MTYDIFLTGTDTNVGKSVASAWCMLHYGMSYWKPVQSGLTPSTDTRDVQHITGLGDDDFHPETYRLTHALSPHEAARRDSVTIDINAFTRPNTPKPLAIEGAGGLMVPLNDRYFVVDLIAQLNVPTILVCRSQLGTINHTLLSLEAMRARGLLIAGLIINGPKTPHNRQALEEYGKVPVLVEIDHLEQVTKDALLNMKPEFDVFEGIKEGMKNAA